MRRFIGAIGILTLGVACSSWAPLTAEGELVQLATPKFTEGCKSIGKARAKTTSKVGLFGRSEEKIREELTSLARNEAAKMGGTTISPMGPAENGEQLFGVYVCTGG